MSSFTQLFSFETLSNQDCLNEKEAKVYYICQYARKF